MRYVILVVVLGLADWFVPTAEHVLQRLQDSLAVLSPELVPIHERLVNVRRKLVALAAKETAREAAAENNKQATIVPEPLHSKPPSKEPTPPLDGETRSGADSAPDSESEAKTPTKETTPKPELPQAEKDRVKVKAELKALMEELRKIDSLSIISLRDRELTDVNYYSAVLRVAVADSLALAVSLDVLYLFLWLSNTRIPSNQETCGRQVLGSGRNGPRVSSGLLISA